MASPGVGARRWRLGALESRTPSGCAHGAAGIEHAHSNAVTPERLTLGARLRTRRLDRGLSLGTLARRVGCAPSYLSAIETERRNAPSASLLNGLEEALGLVPGELVSIADRARLSPALRDRLEQLEQDRRDARRLAAILLDAPNPKPNPNPNPNPIHTHTHNHTPTPIHACTSAHRASLGGALDDEVARLARRLACSGQDAHATFDLTDDAMAPEYRAGDAVLAVRTERIEHGRDGLFQLGPGKAPMLRRQFIDADGGLRLQPLNPSHPPTWVASDAVSRRWRPVALHRPLDGPSGHAPGPHGE
ncbi:MAG: LexA family transcriptional regulator [Planctomycetota bacterium]